MIDKKQPRPPPPSSGVKPTKTNGGYGTVVATALLGAILVGGVFAAEHRGLGALRGGIRRGDVRDDGRSRGLSVEEEGPKTPASHESRTSSFAGFDASVKEANDNAPTEMIRELDLEGGDDVTPFIIGGGPLDRGVWEKSRRYLVDINVNDEGFHSCGATLISSRVVLTAARELNR
jgi:hypothetical protein